MKKKDARINFLEALDELEKEKGIKKEELIETIELALLAAYKKNYGDDSNVDISIDKDDGEIKIYKSRKVVADEETYDNAVEIPLSEAKTYKKRAKVGDNINIDIYCEEFRRNAVQNAKQIVIQKVRESEREHIYEIFKEKEFDILTGIIRRIDEKKNIFIEFNGIELILPPSEQSMSDVYRVGERIKVYLMLVERTNRFPKIMISRKHEGLLRRMLELEIPEVGNGMIQIKSIAREPGSRSKVAVYSEIKNIDIIGACIGQNQNRIKNIVYELSGEKIDIIIWSEDIKEFVTSSLSPAQVMSVSIDEDNTTASVIVDASQLSLAIGKNGQNARLAARLTGLKIDIGVNE